MSEETATATPAAPAAPAAPAPEASHWSEQVTAPVAATPAAPEVPEIPYAVSEDGRLQMTTKVNGEEAKLTLSPEEVVDRIRKGETFFRNQAELKQKEAELLQQAEQLKSYDQITLQQAKELQDLRSTDPAKFNELMYSMNKQLVDKPQETQPTSILNDDTSKLIDGIAQIAKDKPELGVLNDIATAFRQLSEQSASELSAVKQELAKATGTTTKLEENLKQTEEQKKVALQNRQLNNAKTFLVEAGVTEEAIRSKAEAYNKLFYGGMDPIEAAKIIYAIDMKSTQQKPPAEEQPFVPMSPGSALSNGSGPTDAEAEKEMAIFGRRLETPT